MNELQLVVRPSAEGGIPGLWRAVLLDGGQVVERFPELTTAQVEDVSRKRQARIVNADSASTPAQT